MTFATLFSNVSAMLFGESPLGAAHDPDRPIVEAMIEAVVVAVDPRLRMVSGYREKLAPGVRRTIVHMRELGREVPEPVDLTFLDAVTLFFLDGHEFLTLLIHYRFKGY